MKKEICLNCEGEGICLVCNNWGYVIRNKTSKKEKCVPCSSSGFCQKCKGSGVIDSILQNKQDLTANDKEELNKR